MGSLNGFLLDSLAPRWTCEHHTVGFQAGAIFTPMLNLKSTCHKFIMEREDELSSFHDPAIVLNVELSIAGKDMALKSAGLYLDPIL